MNGDGIVISQQELRALYQQREQLLVSQQELEAWTLCLLGEIAAQSDSPAFEEAETHYKQALALANELGMRPLQAHCHRALGQIYRQLADGEQARMELRAAIDLYQDMEMSLWLPETETMFADLEGHHDL
jgi:tetratricopeptide (TPR) repeat protein